MSSFHGKKCDWCGAEEREPSPQEETAMLARADQQPPPPTWLTLFGPVDFSDLCPSCARVAILGMKHAKVIRALIMDHQERST